MPPTRVALPPVNLILLIVGITVVPLAIVSWLGWRLVAQDRLLETHQVGQQTERAADLVVAAIQRAVAGDAQRSREDTQELPPGAASVVFVPGAVKARPRERLAYLPVIPRLPEVASAVFAEVEQVEFRRQDHAAAAGILRQMSGSADPAVKAGALLRLGRNLRAGGQRQEALLAYSRLRDLDGLAIDGTPVSLVSQYARCQLFQQEKRWADLRAEARRLSQDLESARWLLTAPLYWLYKSDAAKWSRSPEAPDAAPMPEPRSQSEVFAEATDLLWQRRAALAASRQVSMNVAGQRLAVVWMKSGESVRILLALPAFVESRWLAAAEPLIREYNLAVVLRDTDDTLAFGNQPGGKAQATRKAVETGLPWDVTVASFDGRGLPAFAQRRRLLVAGFAVLAIMCLAASCLILRSVNRELAVARLKSDFVAAVSHEFRTPLTSLRQFTDMLREHPDLDEERRRLCYDAQSRANERLTRLVESLLDFGRMDAGTRRYDFALHDCAGLAERVVDDFRNQAQAADHVIAFQAKSSAPIEAEPESLSRALWNLLDNAVKYSPGTDTVDVAVERRAHSVVIAVRDRGMGIPASEQLAIFGKFRRGEQARARGIKGTGIGLAITDEIVRAHHGRLEVASEFGLGSTFTITLPVKD